MKIYTDKIHRNSIVTHQRSRNKPTKNIQDNRHNYSAVIQNMKDKELIFLREKWEIVETQLDKIWENNNDVTIPIASELEAIRQMLNSPADKYEYKYVLKKIEGIKKWIQNGRNMSLDELSRQILGFPPNIIRPQLAQPLDNGDFYLEGISKSAFSDKIPKGADSKIISQFEKAIEAYDINWNAFRGNTHNNVFSVKYNTTFKAHFQDGQVKLYIDTEKGRNSQLRAIYSLDGRKLRFVGFDSH